MWHELIWPRKGSSGKPKVNTVTKLLFPQKVDISFTARATSNFSTRSWSSLKSKDYIINVTAFCSDGILTSTPGLSA